MFYSLVGIVSFIILIVVNYDIFFDRNYRASNRKAFLSYRFFAATIGFFYLTDILWGYLDPLENKIYVTIDTAFYFINMSILLLAWTYFVANFVSHAKGVNITLRIIGVILALTGVTLVIVNFFTPVLFTYNAAEYDPKLGRYIFLTLQIAAFVFATVYTTIALVKEKDSFSKGRLSTLSISSLVMAGAILAQVWYPNFPVYSMGLTVSSVIIYVFIVSAQRTQFQKALVESEHKRHAQSKEIDYARQLAYIDPLTGVKNKHAFVELESTLDEMIRKKEINEFSLIIFDLNDLKTVNDTLGHEMGDKYITKSCQLISQYFPGEEIFRFGGDEFVLIIQGESYQDRYRRLDDFNKYIEGNNESDYIVIAAGISDYIPEKDNTLRSIFLRADERMYARKRRLKEIKSLAKPEETTNRLTGASLSSIRYDMYEMFYRSDSISLIDMLNGSSCDEIVEVDLEHDTFKQHYHVDGKYFVPNVGSSYCELLDFTSKYIIHPDDLGTYLGLMQIDGFFDRLKNARIPNFDFAHFRYKLQDGSYRWVEQVVIAGEEYGIPEGMFRMYVFDINNIKSRQLGNISDEAIATIGKDIMTGLYASKEFLIKAEEIINNDRDTQWCLLSLDIEHFKLFDEWFGREKGDILLTQLGHLLKENEAFINGLAGYFGSDDFVVLCEYNMDRIKVLYEKIHDLINSFGFSAGFIPVIGVAVIYKDMVLVDAFDRATIAASRAKGDVKNNIVVYDYEEQFKAEHELRLLTDFMHALQNDEITFYVQPQVKIPSGKIVAGEALARWIKKDGTLVPNGEIIPVLEKYGFVTDLDKHLWEKICRWLSERIKKEEIIVPISLNVSKIDIFNIDVLQCFIDLCEKYHLPHELIKIEITESAYAENVAIIDNLVKKLRSNGFMVLMDDFGTGYSSLNMLSTLKLDAIKLDAYFLQFGDNDYRKGINILESVINMAKSMALPIIVEGVEKKNQVDFLTDLGVNFVQGYYFYKALPAKEFEKLISDSKNIDEHGLEVKRNQQFRLREFLDKNIYSDYMLNNIIGSVAIYSWDGVHVDIVRYNQQFVDTVGIQEFSSRLVNIEQFMPEEDRPKITAALRHAKEDRLVGSSAILRFYITNGILTSYRMKFFYIGKKEGTDRFYGSASNVTDYVDLVEGKQLIAKYSLDNLIFVRRINDKWYYSVISHALSNLIGLSPSELETELNNGKFFHRVQQQKEITNFIKEVESGSKESGVVFGKDIIVSSNKHQKIKIHLSVEYVGNQSNNIVYVLRTWKVNDQSN